MRTSIVASVAVAAVLALGGCVAGPVGALHPARSASEAIAPTVPANLRPAAVPEIDTLTSDALACGRPISSVTFPRASNEVALRRTDASVRFDISNVAASADGRTTIVSARLSADTGVVEDENAGAAYSGSVTAALIRGGKVVAISTGAVAAGVTRHSETGLVTTALAARSCSSGSRLPNGTYSLIVIGPSVRYLGETVPVADGVQAIRLENGILIGDITSAPDSPWRGSGVPTCGTPVSVSALRAFARKNLAERESIGLVATITGFEPHANAEGWFFTIRVRNVGRAPITLEQGDPRSVPGGASTAVVAGGRVVSAPDAVDFGVTQPKTVTLASGATLTAAADAPAAGCTLSEDYTTFGPRLPGTSHLAYIDLGLITQAGVGIALLQRYDFTRGDGRPELVR